MSLVSPQVPLGPWVSVAQKDQRGKKAAWVRTDSSMHSSPYLLINKPLPGAGSMQGPGLEDSMHADVRVTWG